MESLKEPWGRFGNYEDENDSPERGKKFFKIRLRNAQDLFEPCFVCRADSESEALRKFMLKLPVKDRVNFYDIQEISRETYEGVKMSEDGLDKVDN